MSNPLFRCWLLFSALPALWSAEPIPPGSAENSKKIYLSILCVSAVNYCNIFKCIVPLTPEATPEATPEVTEQDAEEVTAQVERVKHICKFWTPLSGTSHLNRLCTKDPQASLPVLRACGSAPRLGGIRNIFWRL